ncbi:hypothetical protein [Bacillus toyonensis]|uniref:hypothetical protein n=1 Tax=Bacillus toyonensis TaxID=155322 RepID=UPI001C0AE507|nr:hypothetical protein [Bacillus toyonensis]MBU4642992.1 hypothetical protein [Bacillus toyonensis]
MRLSIEEKIDFVEYEWFDFTGDNNKTGLMKELYDLKNKLDPDLRSMFIHKITNLYTNFLYLAENHCGDSNINKKLFKKDWNRCIYSYSRLLIFEKMIKNIGNKEFRLPKEVRCQFYRFKDLNIESAEGHFYKMKYNLEEK